MELRITGAVAALGPLRDGLLCVTLRGPNVSFSALALVAPLVLLTAFFSLSDSDSPPVFNGLSLLVALSLVAPRGRSSGLVTRPSGYLRRALWAARIPRANG